jgi:hypothetical protein
MSKTTRKVALRQPAKLNGEDTTITWDAVLERVGVELTDVDHIRYPYLWNDEADEGAPPTVFADKALLRAWIATQAPTQVCDGPGCQKVHEAHQKGACVGRMARANALNRTVAELVHKVRDVNPKLRVDARTVSDFLDGQDISQRPTQRRPGPWDKPSTGRTADGIEFTEQLGHRWHHIPGEPSAFPTTRSHDD